MTSPARVSTGEHRRARWDDALLAAQLFSIDPAGLGGVAVRVSPGPVRDLWTDHLRAVLEEGAPVRRLPANIADDRLLGGIDLAATLQSGRLVVQNGVLAEADGGVVLIPMAERLDTGVAARIAGVLDRHSIQIEREGIARHIPTSIGVVALDESATDDERLPPALSERLAFHIDLSEISARGLDAGSSDAVEINAARACLAEVATAGDDIIQALAATSMSFGIDSIVAPLLALRAARASAALAGRTLVNVDDAVIAARLVLGPRALILPQAEPTNDDGARDDSPDSNAQSADSAEQQSQSSPSVADLDEILCAAVKASLPAGLLAMIAKGQSDRTPSSLRNGGGKLQASLRRGRPVGVRMAPMRSGSRLALVDTLRAAAPWQVVRRRAAKSKSKRKLIDVRPEDFRIKKFALSRESTLIFCVDASGSTAFQRLAEAKGAVELLLAEAYIERTYAALIAFRGSRAELLLPPSRSLTRAKSLLSTLPGGGGTPLAAGIDIAMATAMSERAKGRDPLIVMLTDGRANIARDGQPARPRAFDDAMMAARQIAVRKVAAVFVDTSPRARDEGAQLADAMGARYVAMPRVDASKVCDVVRAAAP